MDCRWPVGLLPMTEHWNTWAKKGIDAKKDSGAEDVQGFDNQIQIHVWFISDCG